MASIQFCGVSKVYGGAVPVAGMPADDAEQESSRASKNAGEFRAVDGVDLEVYSGELFVLMGPSGSGKTTLLRLIAGFEEPTTGVVRIDDRDQRGVAARERNTAMVFQGLGLYGHLTARENLAFGLRMRSPGKLLSRWLGRSAKNEKDVDQAIRSVAELLGITALLEKRPGELSGGEQQRVAIGRALVRQPSVFLLDEPLASLDGPTRLTLRREIKQLQRRLGVTTVYVTHDQGEALALGDRIGVLHQGRLQQVGTPEEVYRQPANRWVASLFGLGMNFVAGSIEQSVSGPEWKSSHWWRKGDWWSPLPESMRQQAEQGRLVRVVLGVRPDDLVVATEGPRNEQACWSGEVEAVEYQGTATYVQVRGLSLQEGGQPPVVLARVKEGWFQPGDSVLLELNQEKVCWFNAATGANLGRKSAERGAK